MIPIFVIEVRPPILRILGPEVVSPSVLSNFYNSGSATGIRYLEFIDPARLWIAAPVHVRPHPRRLLTRWDSAGSFCF